jgi:hypothetical protein
MKRFFIPLLLFVPSAMAAADLASSEDREHSYRTCRIGFIQDWTGLDGPEVGHGWHVYPVKDDPVWEGREIPEFAKALVGGEICPDLDSRGLPTRRYFILENHYCDKKEQYVREYYEFWHTQGKAIPKLTRIADNGKLRSCADAPPSNRRQ